MLYLHWRKSVIFKCKYSCMFWSVIIALSSYIVYYLVTFDNLDPFPNDNDAIVDTNVYLLLTPLILIIWFCYAITINCCFDPQLFRYTKNTFACVVCPGVVLYSDSKLSQI